MQKLLNFLEFFLLLLFANCSILCKRVGVEEQAKRYIKLLMIIRNDKIAAKWRETATRSHSLKFLE